MAEKEALTTGTRVRVVKFAYVDDALAPGATGTVERPAGVTGAVEVRMDNDPGSEPDTWPFYAEELEVITEEAE